MFNTKYYKFTSENLPLFVIQKIFIVENCNTPTKKYAFNFFPITLVKQNNFYKKSFILGFFIFFTYCEIYCIRVLTSNLVLVVIML